MAYEPKYVEPGYTKSPTADKYLDMAIKCEEKGMSLQAKHRIPLILCIFPCLMGVLIMPAAFRISQTLMGN